MPADPDRARARLPRDAGEAKPSQARSVGDLTTLLRAWQNGDRSVSDPLFERLHLALRRIASRAVAATPPAALHTTELVSEIYLRLERHRRATWASRNHFLAVVSKIARGVLVDQRRERGSLKRGGDMLEVSLDDRHAPIDPDTGPDLIAVEQALAQLDEVDPEAAQVVMLKFFAGLELEEIATLLGTSRSTVIRRWRYARAWLYQQLGPRASDSTSG